VFATTGAIGLVMVQLTIQSASADNVMVNFGQWLVPLGTLLVLAMIFFKWRLKPAPRVQGVTR
jgi:lipopolysaccharide export system permease protein